MKTSGRRAANLRDIFPSRRRLPHVLSVAAKPLKRSGRPAVPRVPRGRSNLRTNVPGDGMASAPGGKSYGYLGYDWPLLVEVIASLLLGFSPGC